MILAVNRRPPARVANSTLLPLANIGKARPRGVESHSRF